MPLFVLATPIGNLSDLTPRAEEVLRSADVLFCEDTRVSRRLLSARGLPTPTLRAADAHRELQVADELVERLRRGERVVFMSDAGTPGVSDPGGRLVEAAHAAGQVVVPIPGPSSVITALSASGLPATPFHFVGYPPRAGGARRRWIAEHSRLPGTLVMLESGRRAGGLIAALAAALPDRQGCLCRELTKLHEELRRGALVDLPTEPQRGEVVIVVGPGAPVPVADQPVGEGLKDVARVLARRWGVSRSEAYRRLLDLEQE